MHYVKQREFDSKAIQDISMRCKDNTGFRVIVKELKFCGMWWLPLIIITIVFQIILPNSIFPKEKLPTTPIFYRRSWRMLKSSAKISGNLLSFISNILDPSSVYSSKVGWIKCCTSPNFGFKKIKNCYHDYAWAFSKFALHKYAHLIKFGAPNEHLTLTSLACALFISVFGASIYW